MVITGGRDSSRSSLSSAAPALMADVSSATSARRVLTLYAAAATVATWWSITWFTDTMMPCRISCLITSTGDWSSNSASSFTVMVSGSTSTRGVLRRGSPRLGRLAPAVRCWVVVMDNTSWRRRTRWSQCSNSVAFRCLNPSLWREGCAPGRVSPTRVPNTPRGCTNMLRARWLARSGRAAPDRPACGRPAPTGLSALSGHRRCNCVRVCVAFWESLLPFVGRES